MNKDPLLELIVAELQEKHSCHTVILYGSRARGEETSTSDYDILGIKESGDVFRDARLWKGVYLDIFIYPELKTESPDESLLHIRNGKILIQKGDLATRLFSRLKEIDQAGPKKLPADEIQARRVWVGKMLNRAKAGDIEGNYRRAWLLFDLLEDYFVTRGEWYRGPKESLKWLQVHQPDLYRKYDEALQPGAPIAAIEELVREIHQ
jgi:predicted nucleotidyltransferase